MRRQVDFHSLAQMLTRMSQADLARSFPWGSEGTAYWWASIYVAHDHEHAEGLRDAVDISDKVTSPQMPKRPGNVTYRPLTEASALFDDRQNVTVSSSRLKLGNTQHLRLHRLHN
jgi:hypothetical protein